MDKMKLEIVTQLVDQASEGLGHIKGGFLGMAGAMTAGNLAAQAISSGLGMATDFIKDSVKAAESDEQAMAQLGAVIKSTGGAAGVTAQSAKDLSEELQRTTPISHDATLAAEDMLLTFTNIHKDTFPAVTKATADMATAMNGGAIPNADQMRQTALQLGKALNDPAAGLTKLMRVGVTFSDAQKEQIKTMQAAGNTAGAQSVILKELQKEFGGSAEAAGHTFAGSLQMLNNNFDLFKEKVGTAILQAIIPLTESIAKFVSSDKFQHWLDFVTNTLLPALVKGLGIVIGWIIKLAEGIGKQLMPVVDGVRVFFSLLVQMFEGADPTLSKSDTRFAGLAKTMLKFQPIVDAVRVFFSLLWQVLHGADPTLSPADAKFGQLARTMSNISYFITQQLIPTLVHLWTTIGRDVVEAVKFLLPSLEALWNTLATKLFPAIWNLIQAALPPLMALIKFLAPIIGVVLVAAIWVFINVLNVVINILSAVINIIATVIRWIANWVSFMINGTRQVIGIVMQVEGAVFNALISPWVNAFRFIQGVIDGIKNAIGGMGKAISGGLHSLHIPGFAGGTNFAPGGVALVGENGPELVNLPRGSRVTPNSAMGGNTTNSKSVSIGQVVINTPAAAQEFWRGLDQDTVNLSKGLTPVRGAY